MNVLSSLINFMQDRLEEMEVIYQQGVIPGQLDSTEKEELKGRIKELRRIIKIAERMKERNDEL